MADVQMCDMNVQFVLIISNNNNNDDENNKMHRSLTR